MIENTKPPNAPAEQENLAAHANQSVAQDYSEVKQEAEKFADTVRSFFRFLTRIPGSFFAALVVGLVLAAVGELLTDYLFQNQMHGGSGFFLRLMSLLLKEVGFAISVSVIAFFGYEHLKHARGDFDQLKRMDGALVSIDLARKKLQDTESLQASVAMLSARIERQGEDLQKALTSNLKLTHKLATIHTNLVGLNEGNTYKQCESALALIFSDIEGGKEFSHSVQKLLTAARQLKNSESYRQDLQPYLGFLAWLIEQVPNHYAKALSHFVTTDDSTNLVRDIPSSTSIASQLLSTYMNLMNAGDEYLAVSNILFWDAAQWNSFQSEVRVACCERGVKSRRIVNLCSYIARRERQELTDAEVKQVRERIATHVDLQAAAPDNYQIRFFGPREVQKAAQNFDETHRLATMACGIFLYTHNGVRQGKVIRAQDETISTIIFDHNLDFYHRLFERVWQEASQENPFIGNEFHYG